MDIVSKSSALREVRKLLNILDVHGNVLVPSLNNQETTAITRLTHFLDLLRNDYGIDTKDKLLTELENLEKEYPSK